MKLPKMGNWSKGLAVLAVALVMCVGGLTGTARAGGACAEGWVCFWTDTWYSGNQYNAYLSGNGCYGIPAGFNDQISSLANITNKYLRLHVDAGCSTPWYLSSLNIDPDASKDTLPSINDRISSFRVCSTAC